MKETSSQDGALTHSEDVTKTAQTLDTLKAIGGEVERLARIKGFCVEVSEDAALRLVKRPRDPLPAWQTRKRSGQWHAYAHRIVEWFERQRFQILCDGYPRPRGID